MVSSQTNDGGIVRWLNERLEVLYKESESAKREFDRMVSGSLDSAAESNS